MKRTIRLRESEVRRMVSESIKRVLKENNYNPIDYELMAYSNTKIDYEYIIHLIQNIVTPNDDEEAALIRSYNLLTAKPVIAKSFLKNTVRKLPFIKLLKNTLFSFLEISFRP